MQCLRLCPLVTIPKHSWSFVSVILTPPCSMQRWTWSIISRVPLCCHGSKVGCFVSSGAPMLLRTMPWFSKTSRRRPKDWSLWLWVACPVRFPLQEAPFLFRMLDPVQLWPGRSQMFWALRLTVLFTDYLKGGSRSRTCSRTMWLLMVALCWYATAGGIKVETNLQCDAV